MVAIALDANCNSVNRSKVAIIFFFSHKFNEQSWREGKLFIQSTGFNSKSAGTLYFSFAFSNSVLFIGPTTSFCA